MAIRQGVTEKLEAEGVMRWIGGRIKLDSALMSQY